MESLKLVISRLLSQPEIKLLGIIFCLWMISYMLRNLLLLYKPFHFLICPKCNGEISRQRRNFLQKIITFLLGIKPYQCDKCKWKGWKFSSELLRKIHD